MVTAYTYIIIVRVEATCFTGSTLEKRFIKAEILCIIVISAIFGVHLSHRTEAYVLEKKMCLLPRYHGSHGIKRCVFALPPDLCLFICAFCI